MNSCPVKTTCLKFLVTLGMLTSAAESLGAAEAAATPAWPNETIDSWRGFQRHTFKIDGCIAWVVEPKQAAPGRPWTWCMEFPDAFTDRTGVPQLLEKGFFHVHIKVGNTFGCPDAVKHCNAFYQAITAQGLAKKGTLIGLSRGGLYAYNWAARNPDKSSSSTSRGSEIIRTGWMTPSHWWISFWKRRHRH